MFRRFVRLFLVTAASAAALQGAPPVAAQSIWIPRDRDLSVTLEAVRPNLEDTNEAAFSTAMALTGRVPIGSRLWFVGEVPYVRIGASATKPSPDPYAYSYTPDEGGTIGNPYLGLEFHSAGPVFGEFGIRPPLTSSKAQRMDAVELGLVSDFTNRFEAFLPKVFSVHAAVNLREATGSHIAYRLRLAPALTIPTEGATEAELYAIYSWQIGYEGTNARIGSAISGRTLLTEDYANLGARSVTQLEFHGDFGAWPVRPGMSLRLPLGEMGHDVSAIWGFTVSYSR
jgi:hypothetical protein